MITLNRYSIHRIPTNEVLPAQENTKGKEAVSDYVRGLLGSLRKEPSTRSYSFAQDRKPEARALLLDMLCAEEAKFLASAQALANRLHEKQLRVQKGPIDIQEGALLCAEVQDGNDRLLLLAKLDWVDYLSNKTWNREAGLPFEKNRLLKTCLCEMDSAGKAWEFGAISIYDNNSTIAAFWWRDFLELTELTTDATNSQRAYDAWQKLLKQHVKPTSPADYHNLRSAVAFRFRNDPAYDHEKFVQALLDNYQASNSDLDVKKVASAARALPQRLDVPGKRFDPRFGIDSKACNIRIKPIRLTEGIDLVLREPLENLRSIIRAEKVRGEKGVFVVSEEGYGQVASKSA